MNSRLLLSLMALTACAPDQTRMAVQAQAAGGQLAYGAPTLAAAKRAFFGEDDGSAGGGGTGGGGSDLLSPTDPVALHGLPPAAMALTLGRQDDLGHGMHLTSTILIGHQHLRGTLPDGFGVLTDPLQIEIWAQSLGVQMTLGQTRPLPYGLHIDYAAGLGLTRLQSATHLQSALLDVRGRALQVLPYGLAELRLAGRTGPAVLGSLYVFQGQATELRLGIEQAF